MYVPRFRKFFGIAEVQEFVVDTVIAVEAKIKWLYDYKVIGVAKKN